MKSPRPLTQRTVKKIPNGQPNKRELYLGTDASARENNYYLSFRTTS